MKGAFILANLPDFYERVSEFLVSQGAATAPDRTTQLNNPTRASLTVFGSLDADFEDDLRAEPTAYRGSAALLKADAKACWIECRSEDEFVDQVQSIAHALNTPLWVLDGDGVLWNSTSLVPRELTL